MPTNKNASIRYQALDRCFHDIHHRYYLEDLIEKCEEALYQFNGTGGVSRRQIFDDIKFMESEAGWSIPLARRKEGKKTYYLYEDADFSINNQPLTQKEAEQMETAIVTLSRFRGMHSCEWVEEVISNLEWRFNLKRSEHEIIGFEQNTRLRGLQYLSRIIDAALQQQVLRITYHSYKEEATERCLTVHPYYIKQYNNRWFVMALDNDTQFLCNLALDRIRSLETIKEIPFRENKEIDFSNYFNDVIGVTLPNSPTEKEHIVLRFCPRQFAYVMAKPLHTSQQVIDATQHLLSIDVKPNYELDYHILSLGPDVEVLEPTSYREHIHQKLIETINKYNAVKIGCTVEE